MGKEIFGKPKYGGKGNFKPAFKTKEGDTVFRVIPPMGSLKDKNEWSKFHKMHFGYKGVNKQDPTKQKARPFACIEVKNRRTKMIDRECPECEYIRDQTELLADRIANLKAEGKSDAEIKANPQVALIQGRIKGKDAHNLDKKFYMNVKLDTGEFGVLSMPYKAHKALETTIKELAKNRPDLDPIEADQGVWFKLHREGTGTDTDYSCSVVRETKVKDGEPVEVIKKGALTDADADKAETDCRDLIECSAIELSADQIRMLVASSGDAEEVDAIFDMAIDARERSASKKKAAEQKAQEKKAPPPVEEEPEDDEPEDDEPSAPPAEDPVEKAKLERLAAIKARSAEKAKADAEAKAKADAEKKQPTISAADVQNMSDEDFLKMMGDTSKL